MRVLSTISDLRAALKPMRRAGLSIGMVPTMGYLHEGHMQLVACARAANDIVVTSIFVNPLQFGKNEDLGKYPRNLARDCDLLEKAGVDFVFAPEVNDMYPRPMETVVDVPALGSQLEGEARPGHFAGVATVVTKLFNIACPTRAYFGEKDFQQLQIIRRIVDDLAQPVEIVGVPTVRETDGLACSSRNVYLSKEDRIAAVIIPRALDEAARLVKDGMRDPEALEQAISTFISGESRAAPEVIAIRDPQTLQKVEKIGNEPVLLLLFVRFGTTKLLDNRVLVSNLG